MIIDVRSDSNKTLLHNLDRIAHVKQQQLPMEFINLLQNPCIPSWSSVVPAGCCCSLPSDPVFAPPLSTPKRIMLQYTRNHGKLRATLAVEQSDHNTLPSYQPTGSETFAYSQCHTATNACAAPWLRCAQNHLFYPFSIEWETVDGLVFVLENATPLRTIGPEMGKGTSN